MTPLQHLTPTLIATGLPWHAKQGTKHTKIYVRGRLVGIVPQKGSESSGRAMLNVRAQIRRAARGLS